MPDDLIVLHGLARSRWSMLRAAAAGRQSGYRVHNLAYPSRRRSIEKLTDWLDGAVIQHRAAGTRVHFLTHSLGGILVRALLARRRPAGLGRVVMLAPPNHGSEIVDMFRRRALSALAFRALFGPAGQQLGVDGLPASLPPADYPVGIIAGCRAINPVGMPVLPQPHDGTMSVASTRLSGMADHLVVEASHGLIMWHGKALDQAMHFLAEGRFA